jgi:hypothetical protein
MRLTPRHTADTKSRAGIVIGLAAAAGAFGAAMMSAATAPSARADDFTDIINAVDGDFSAGQAAFTVAASDFSSSDLTAGVAAIFDGTNDDLLSAPDNLLGGTVEALTSETISPTENWGLVVPTSFSDALSLAQSDITFGEDFFSTGATDLASGEYGYATFVDLFGSDLLSVEPLEDLLLGAVASF